MSGAFQGSAFLYPPDPGGISASTTDKVRCGEQASVVSLRSVSVAVKVRGESDAHPRGPSRTSCAGNRRSTTGEATAHQVGLDRSEIC